jgi:hypothetical protein
MRIAVPRLQVDPRLATGATMESAKKWRTAVQSVPVKTVFDVITDFLASDPNPQAVLDYRLPAELEARASELLARKRQERLTFDEELELFDFIRADDMMTLLKAKTRLRLSGQA